MAPKKKKKRVVKEPTGIESKFMDISEVDNPTILTIYGRSGTGKTTIAGTLPKPLLLIDMKDKGTDSAKRADLEVGDITVVSCDNFDELHDIYDFLLSNPKRFKSVCIDHLTKAQSQALDLVKNEVGKDKVSQQMFGFASTYMQEIISNFINLTDLGILPCFLVQDRMDDGDGDGEDQLMPEVGPGLMPSISKMLCAGSRVIGHTYLQEKVITKSGKVDRKIEYRLRLGPNPYYITKVTRPPETECPAYIVDATYEEIESIIKGEWKPKKLVKKKKRNNKK